MNLNPLSGNPLNSSLIVFLTRMAYTNWPFCVHVIIAWKWNKKMNEFNLLQITFWPCKHAFFLFLDLVMEIQWVAWRLSACLSGLGEKPHLIKKEWRVDHGYDKICNFKLEYMIPVRGRWLVGTIVSFEETWHVFSWLWWPYLTFWPRDAPVKLITSHHNTLWFWGANRYWDVSLLLLFDCEFHLLNLFTILRDKGQATINA